MQFLAWQWIWATSALILLLLIYLIRRKVPKKYFAAFFFIQKQRTKSQSVRWFKNLPINWLFILHILIFTSLIVALMQPYIWVPATFAKAHSVHIIDVSASMQTALPNIKSDIIPTVSNTIVVAGAQPSVPIQQQNALSARNALTALRVQDIPSHLLDTLFFVHTMDIHDAVIHVYSDFVGITQQQIEQWSATMETNNNIVVLHTYQPAHRSVGIIDATITQDVVEATIKNFEHTPQTITYTYEDIQEQFDIAAQDVIVLQLPTQRGVLRLHSDDMQADNYLYVTVPHQEHKQMLYITNNPNTLTATLFDVLPNIAYTIYTPPSTQSLAHPLLMIEGIDRQRMLAGTIHQALEQVQQGALLIVAVDEELYSFANEFPFPIGYIQEGTVTIAQHHIANQLVYQQEESYYYSNMTALLVDEQRRTVVGLQQYGQGLIVFYGLQEDTFQLSYNYPIMIKRITDLFFEQPSIHTVHKKTDEQQPMVGFSTQQSIEYAHNFLRIENYDQPHIDTTYTTQGARQQFVLSPFLLALALCFMILEFIVMRWRKEV
ncbi:MAG: BatA domain-containing protein [Candidatus Woesearchaeota archaeon]